MSQLRFVVLRHEGVADPHFDLMFESAHDAPLLTWRTREWPITRETNLTRLASHRREYLDYEGPLSNDRGFVKRIDQGVCEVEWANCAQCVFKLADRPTPIELRQLENDHWLATPVEAGG